MSEFTLVPFGKTPDGRFLSAYETQRGLACGVVCPGCSKSLIARQGKEVVWHFAHQPSEVYASVSAHCFETSIHKAAKSFLASERGKGLALPKYKEAFGPSVEASSTLAEKLVRIRRGESEYWIPQARRRVDVSLDVSFRRLRPDRSTYWSGSSPLIVEIAVNNRKDACYVKDVAQAGLTAMEIDLNPRQVLARASKQGDWIGALKFELRSIPHNRRWLYHPRYGIPAEFKSSAVASRGG